MIANLDMGFTEVNQIHRLGDSGSSEHIISRPVRMWIQLIQTQTMGKTISTTHVAKEFLSFITKPAISTSENWIRSETSLISRSLSLSSEHQEPKNLESKQATLPPNFSIPSVRRELGLIRLAFTHRWRLLYSLDGEVWGVQLATSKEQSFGLSPSDLVIDGVEHQYVGAIIAPIFQLSIGNKYTLLCALLLAKD
ncbi:hypothetical protein VNO77_22688 [Canavalia gladiata]|uniref:Uncharacterized protein n=1 Tax=Canavalia gladiata TaxID=3824 RepID=A0AAN9L411_CANGL